MAPAEQPTFYYDLGSPYAWLAAERIHALLPVVPVWQPILLGGIWQQTGGGSWARTERRDEGMREIERRAKEYGLLPVSWPEDWPSNTLKAMRAAVFAQQAGRAVAFSLAAFRQAFAAGKDLGERRQRPDRGRRLRAAPESRAQGHRAPVDQGPPARGDGRGLRARRARRADRRGGGPALLRGRPPRGGRRGALGRDEQDRPRERAPARRTAGRRRCRARADRWCSTGTRGSRRRAG